MSKLTVLIFLVAIAWYHFSLREVAAPVDLALGWSTMSKVELLDTI